LPKETFTMKTITCAVVTIFTFLRVDAVQISAKKNLNAPAAKPPVAVVTPPYDPSTFSAIAQDHFWTSSMETMFDQHQRAMLHQEIASVPTQKPDWLKAIDGKKSNASNDDDDDDDDDACGPQEEQMTKVANKLTANLKKQKDLQNALKNIQDSNASGLAIDAEAAKVANQTESSALANMLGDMWKEMRMFEGPAFEQVAHMQLAELQNKETHLNMHLATAKEELQFCMSLLNGKTKSSVNASPTQKKAGASGNMFETIVASLFYLISVVLFAYLFKAKKSFSKFFFADPVNQLPNSEDFSFGLFKCFETPRLTVLACCCPCIAWADTMDQTGLLSYWAAFAAFFGLMWLEIYTVGLSGLILWILGVYYRQKIRDNYHIKAPHSLGKDALAWFFCSPCAIVQEAREGPLRRDAGMQGP